MSTKGNRPPAPEISEERERDAWLLRSQGVTQARIAEQLGVSQQAVSKMLAKTGRGLAREFKSKVEVIKAEHSTILEYVASEALQEWNESKEPLITVTVKTGIQKVQAVSTATKTTKETSYEIVDLADETTTKTEDRHADPRYLEAARAALGDIRKIWGADAPQKTEVETKHSGAVALTAPTLEKAAEEMSVWRQEQTQKLKELQEARAAELAAQSQEEE